MEQNPTMERLEDQISWYDRKSRANQKWFKALRTVSIIAGAAIPITSLMRVEPPLITAGIGFLIVVVEGLQQLNQYQSNWMSYRATCEALKHEKFLYAALAGPYTSSQNALTLLAERIESLVSQEHAKWYSTQEQAVKKDRPGEK